MPAVAAPAGRSAEEPLLTQAVPDAGPVVPCTQLPGPDPPRLALVDSADGLNVPLVPPRPGGPLIVGRDTAAWLHDPARTVGQRGGLGDWEGGARQPALTRTACGVRCRYPARHTILPLR